MTVRQPLEEGWETAPEELRTPSALAGTALMLDEGLLHGVVRVAGDSQVFSIKTEKFKPKS
jgi:hypothetical protein